MALNKVENSPYQFSVLSDKEVRLLSGEAILLGFTEGKIYSNQDNTFYIQEFTSGEQYYYMTIPNQILYQNVDKAKKSKDLQRQNTRIDERKK